MNPAVLGSLIGTIVAALVSYLVAARRMSGKIATSDASDLWKESSSIREDYRRQLNTAAERMVALEGRMAKLEQKNNELVRENYELRAQVAAQDLVIEGLRGTISMLERQINGKEA